MTTRPWLLILGIMAATGLGVVAWHDPDSLLHQGIDALRGTADGKPAAQIKTITRSANPAVTNGTLPEASTRPIASSGSAQPPRLTNPLADLQRKEFEAIIARPLFSPSRRPPPPKRVVARAKPVPPIVKPSVVPTRPKVTLSIVGTITNRLGKRIILKDHQTGLHITAAKNAKVSGWRVADIQSSSVLLKKDSWEVRLSVFAK